MNNKSKSKSTSRLLAGKRFFIDPKVDKVTSAKVTQKLLALGGKVEEFLDKGINFALTNDPAIGAAINVFNDCKRPKLSPQSPFGTTSPAVDHNSSMSLRWKRLAKQASAKVQSNSIVDTAKSFGIKIRLIDDVLSWLNKKTEHMNINAEGQLVPPQQPNDIKLKDPCLKVEDFGRSLKPIYEEFESFSHLDFSIKGTKCPMVNANSPVGTKPGGKKNPEKKGFCECCQCSYLNERKHRKTSEHLNFGETESHFSRLDEYVTAQNLNIDKFLSRFKSTREDTDCSDVSLPWVQETKSLDTCLEESSSHSPLKAPEVKSPDAGTPSKKLKTSAATPLRRSPRKCLRGTSPKVCNSVPPQNSSRSSESKRLTFDAKNLDKVTNETSTSKSPMKPIPTLCLTSSAIPDAKRKDLPGSSDFSAKRKQFKCTTSPTVLLEELPHTSTLRKRIQSCEARCSSSPLSVSQLSDSPLFRLRSFKRKVQEIGLVSPKTIESPRQPKRCRLAGESDLTSSSTGLQTLLNSSRGGDTVMEPSFEGF